MIYYRKFCLLIIIAIGFSFLFSSPVKAQTGPVTEEQLARANLNLLKVQADGRPTTSAKIEELTRLATERRDLLLRAFREKPEMTLKYVWDKSIRNAFPPAVKPLIEEEKTLTGEVEVIYAENFSTRFIIRRHFIDTSDYGVIELFSSGDLDDSIAGPSLVVSVAAYLLGNSALLTTPDDKDQTAIISRRRISPPLLGQKKLAVILFKFADQAEAPLPGSIDEIRQSTFINQESLAAYYKETSFDKFTVLGNVFGPYIFSDVKAYDLNCTNNMLDNRRKFNKTFQRLGRGIIASIAKDDSSIKNYDYYIFVTPEVCALTEGFVVEKTNMAFLDGPYNWIIATHEFGHFLGLGHADGFQCYNKDGATLNEIDDSVAGNVCGGTAYSDPFSIMGQPKSGKEVRQINNFHKGQLGWLNRSSTKTITENGVYDITPSNIPSSATPIYRIPIAIGGYQLNTVTNKPPFFYYLEYRKTSGYFDNFLGIDPATRGISLRVAGDYDSMPWLVGTSMLDVTPKTWTYSDAFIGVGMSFRDVKRKITVEVLSADQYLAKVKVTFNSEEKPKVTVLAPNGGEQIPKSGPSYRVKWSANNIPSVQPIKLRLLNSSGGVAYQNNLPNTGSTDFNFSSSSFSPGQYKIELSVTVSGQTITDQSDNFFTLTGSNPPPPPNPTPSPPSSPPSSSPPPPPPDTTPPILRMTPGTGPTEVNKSTRVVITADDPSGVAYIVITAISPPQAIIPWYSANPLIKTCNHTVLYSRNASCWLDVPASQWVQGTVVGISAIDYSPNRNTAVESYIVRPE